MVKIIFIIIAMLSLGGCFLNNATCLPNCPYKEVCIKNKDGSYEKVGIHAKGNHDTCECEYSTDEGEIVNDDYCK